MISLSNSSLGLYVECPRCFWLRFNKKINRPAGIFPTLPSGMDLIIKEYFNRYRDKGILPPLVQGKLPGKLANVSLNLKYTDEELGIRITGKLDECLELEDGRLVPLDHKTKGSLPTGVEYSQNYYQRQMDTYSLLLEKCGHQTKREAYLIYYSPSAGELHEGIPFKIAVHRVETNPQNVRETFRDAKECLVGEIPASGPECGFCNWKRSINGLEDFSPE